jgi:signal transduction histidine kinase
MNLADNAAVHSDPGSTITLGSRADDDTVYFWVSDEGPGIPLAEQKHIFERFARGRGGPRRTDGVGLGLAIVKTIVEAHGGKVHIASAVGEGSTFTLALPLSGHEADT